jgi:hypothetical protein
MSNKEIPIKGDVSFRVKLLELDIQHAKLYDAKFHLNTLYIIPDTKIIFRARKLYGA